jgi:putative ABC transport system substrate-binding protein
MNRREFITLIGGVAATWPVMARAQQSAMPVIGLLGATSPETAGPLLAAIRQGLKEEGFVEGQNVGIEYRWADNQRERLPGLAAELVNRKVGLILTSGSVPPAMAAKAATSTIPIVFHMGADPVAAGVVDSLNQPGGNITGVSYLSDASSSKRLGLLREVVPASRVIGLLVNPTSPTASTTTNDLEAAARPLGLSLQVVNANSERELNEAFAVLSQRQIEALVLHGDPYFGTRREQIVELAARYALPTMHPGREYAVLGGLMGYSASVTDAYRQEGIYAGRILKGAKPSELPVLQSTKFEFVLNLKTAKALGLAIPPGILAIADEVIE